MVGPIYIEDFKLDSFLNSFIHSFIHIEHLYSASSRELYSEALPTPARLKRAVLS